MNYTQTTTTNGFLNYELTGRNKAIEILKDHGFIHISTTINEYDEVDLFAFTKTMKPCAIEVKLRNVSINQYPDFLIEETKYFSLMKFRLKNFIPVYFCIFSDGYILFNLENHKDNDVKTISCPTTTVNTSSFSEKACYFLKPDTGDIVGRFDSESSASTALVQ